MNTFILKANLVDVINRRIFTAELHVEDGIIADIVEIDEKCDAYILPGLVDSHIHIESSMVTPLAFSRTAVKHGTVGIVSDPHEIANVLGKEGVMFMVENARKTPLKITLGVPSCVPATSFETSGAELLASDLKDLLQIPELTYLAEMMNFPGVISGDKEVMQKLAIAKELSAPIDGHAPGLKGEDLKKYIDAGISTDHECFTVEEAKEKINLGMNVLIREGSGAKNFETLVSLLDEFPDKIMFCSDDLHPDDLEKAHINSLIKRALSKGYDLFNVLRAATYNPIKHYRLDVGLLQLHDPADFIIVDNLDNFSIKETYIDGIKVFGNDEVFIENSSEDPINNFNITEIDVSEIKLPSKESLVNVIEAIDGELITRKIQAEVSLKNGYLNSNVSDDILKIVVINRYKKDLPAVGFIKGFELKKGALASCIAHDSHNIICVGVSDEEIVETINWIIKHKGGIAVNDGESVDGLELEIGGIMTNNSVENASAAYARLSEKASLLGTQLKAPFMTLAFMSLLVIPELKLSDKGLFDGNTFQFTNLVVNEN